MAWSLDHPAPGFRPAWLAGTPRLTLIVLAALMLAAASLAAAGWLPAPAARAGAVTALQGGLLATALAWTARDEGAAAAWDPGPATLAALTLIALAAALTELDPRLGAAWVAPLTVYGWLAASGRLKGMGLGGRPVRAAALAGLAVGAALGGHMLLTASLTFNHRLRTDGAAAYLTALAYDVGVNVPASEAFFRGALLRRAHARWSLAAAVVLTVLASVVRYLLDPRLPSAAEARVGAVVYLGLLGGASAWLVARTGSLAPALAGALTFFAFYRLLGPP
jgi:Type II CAAX prenyl endopeptidase Rce1-like